MTGPETKQCQNPWCGERFERKPTEAPGRWAVRKFCRALCKSHARRGVAVSGAAAVEVAAVESTGLYRPVWRPSGFVLRPGDEGYDEQGMAS